MSNKNSCEPLFEWFKNLKVEIFGKELDIYDSIIFLLWLIILYKILFIEENNFTLVGLSALLASASLMKSINNTSRIEKEKKENEIYSKRLYFITIMSGISKSLDEHFNALNTHMQETCNYEDKEIDVSGYVMKSNLKELENILNDYINLLNNEELPNTLYNIKDNFTESIANIINLKNDMYKIKPRINAMIKIDNEEVIYFRFILKNLNDISKNAQKIKKENIKLY